MSRTIEFRAWHEEAEEYCDGTISNMFKWIEDGQPVLLEQFTGLLDCNGVKIFEGDRVSFFDRDDNAFMMCGVVKFGVRGYPAFDIYDDKNVTYSDEYNTLTNDDDFRFLVIGNIHQNRELLK